MSRHRLQDQEERLRLQQFPVPKLSLRQDTPEFKQRFINFRDLQNRRRVGNRGEFAGEPLATSLEKISLVDDSANLAAGSNIAQLFGASAPALGTARSATDIQGSAGKDFLINFLANFGSGGRTGVVASPQIRQAQADAAIQRQLEQKKAERAERVARREEELIQIQPRLIEIVDNLGRLAKGAEELKNKKDPQTGLISVTDINPIAFAEASNTQDEQELTQLLNGFKDSLRSQNKAITDPIREALRAAGFSTRRLEAEFAKADAEHQRQIQQQASRLRPAFRDPKALQQAGTDLGFLTPQSLRGQQALPGDIKAALTAQLERRAQAQAKRQERPADASEGITAENYVRVTGEIANAAGVVIPTVPPANDAEARLKFSVFEKLVADKSKSADARKRSLAIQTEISERSRLNRESRENVSMLNRGDRISRAHAARKLRATLQTQKELHETGKATIADKRRREINETQDNRRRQNIMLKFEQRGLLEEQKQNFRLSRDDANATIRFALQAEAQVGEVASTIVASALRANPSLGPDILVALEEAQERGDESLIATLSQALKGAFDANVMDSVYDHIAHIAHTSKNKFEQIPRLQGAIQRTGDKESKEAKAYQWQIDLLKAPSHTILKDAADPTAGMRKDSQVTLKNGTHFLRLSTILKEILRENRAFGLGAFPEVAANNIKGILTDISRGFNIPSLDFSRAFNEDIPIAKQLFLAAKFANAGAREPGRLTQIDVDSAIKGAETFGSSLTAIAGLEGAEFEIISRMGDAADITLNGFKLEISPDEAQGLMDRFAEGLRAGKVDNKHLKSRIYSSLAAQNITITTSAIDALVAGARSRAQRKKSP